MLYNDCNDLKDKEIDFLALWNKFMDSNDTKEKELIDLEEYLIEFIKNNLDYIKKNELINELLLYMNLLYDKGAISFTFFLTWSKLINC